MYKSPINIAVREIVERIEDDAVTIVQSFDWRVDREELAKALRYDRDQYQKGYEDGASRIDGKVKKQFVLATGGMGGVIWSCECGWALNKEWVYCPKCGRRLIWEKE